MNLSGTLTVKVDWPLRAEANWVVQYSDTILLADGEHRKVPAISHLPDVDIDIFGTCINKPLLPRKKF